MGMEGRHQTVYKAKTATLKEKFFLGQVVEVYGCSLVEGVLSHQLKQFIIDGNKCVLNKPGVGL